MHRQQLFLQAINVKRYQQQQASTAAHQQGASGQAVNLALELSGQEMQDIGDFFARRVASEPYDASRLASFVTMLTLPVPVLREFLVLIQWKKEATKVCLFSYTPTFLKLPMSSYWLCLSGAESNLLFSFILASVSEVEDGYD